MITHTIVIPVGGKPKDILINANQRLHWRARHRRTKHLRELGEIYVRNAITRGQLTPAATAHIDAYFVWPTAHHRDTPNYYQTIKALIDGAVDAGYLEDDDDKHLDGPFLRDWPERGPCAIRLEITTLEARAA